MRSLFVAVSAVTLLCAVPAFAQSAAPKARASVTLGYTHNFNDVDDLDIGALQARLGYRLNPYFGVEGEAATGIKSGHFDLGGGDDYRRELKSLMAIYGVGYLPLSKHFDLFARAGYGTQHIKQKAFGFRAKFDMESVNYGLGAQYSFDRLNGVRGEYTRYDFQSGNRDVDTLSLSYVRKF